MTEFNITIDGKEFSGHLITFGYSYKIVLFVDDVPVAFEPDEERNFRAVVPIDYIGKIDSNLLKKISEELETSLKS